MGPILVGRAHMPDCHLFIERLGLALFSKLPLSSGARRKAQGARSAGGAGERKKEQRKIYVTQSSQSPQSF